MNKQQQAIELFLQLVVAGPKRRKELIKGQFSFVVVSHGQERIASHGEFFAAGHPPLLGAVKTHAGLALQDVDGGAAFVPFDLAPAPVAAPAAPVAAPAAPVAAPAPVVVTTRSRRVSFGEELTFWNTDFSEKLEFTAPSSGAVIEEVFSDGKVVVTFVGVSRQTWTII